MSPGAAPWRFPQRLEQVWQDAHFCSLVPGPAEAAPHLECLIWPIVLGADATYALTVLSNTPLQAQHCRLVEAYAGQLVLKLQNQRLLDEQANMMRALQHSQHLIAEAEERTKREISEVLHSRVQSRLLVAWYRLGEVQQAHPELAARLEAVREDLDDLREHELRTLSHQLHPEALSVGLVAALQVLATQLQGIIDMAIYVGQSVQHLDGSAATRLSSSQRTVVFRIIEEAVCNVLKHAEAAQVSVHLDYGDTFRLEVVDNGKGFDPATVTPGLGLQCMAARVESIGGHWEIVTQPGGPTHVWAELPL